VFKTLAGRGIFLVAVVVLLFLQNWRSAIIPLIAVPVAIVGTFAVMAALGFSVNNLTLFGLVLAIGIVVDDAIVVVEAVEHHMERGLAPRAATIVAMQGSVRAGHRHRLGADGGVRAVRLHHGHRRPVLPPVRPDHRRLDRHLDDQLADAQPGAGRVAAEAQGARHPAGPGRLHPARPGPGAAGRLGRVRAARPPHRAGPAGPRAWVRPSAWTGPRWCSVRWAGRWPGGCSAGRSTACWPAFGGFNAGFRRATDVYARGVALLLRGAVAVLVIYGGLLFLTYRGFVTTPTGFIPSQDMGYLLVNVQLPDSSSFERTEAVMGRLEQIAREQEGVKHTVCVTGQSLLLSAFGSNFGSMFIILDEFSHRHAPGLYGEAIAGKLRKAYTARVPDATITVLGPPPVRGVGRAGGFKLMVEDRRGDAGLATLQGQTENLTEQANTQPDLVGLTSVFRANVPQLYVAVDRRECMSKQVAPRDLFNAMQVYLGSLYVNDFNRFGRTWQVVVQADARFRNGVEDIKRLKVRNAQGRMVPIGALAEIREVNGPLVLTRYNMYTAAPINGSAAPGVSSGDAIALMGQLARRELLPSMAIEWTELAYLELQAGNTAMLVFGCAVVMVFLVLAAQYESWALPLAVILVVPLCLLCALAGVNYAKQDVNIFTQIGFVVLVGLACKNAILIVEFARSAAAAGLPARGGPGACRLRLRPIVMTSLAFILGVCPAGLARAPGPRCGDARHDGLRGMLG
jgi:multidrug efflux pump